MEEFQFICVFNNYRKAEQLQYCWSLLGVLLEHGIDEFADLVGILIDGFESIVKYFLAHLIGIITFTGKGHLECAQSVKYYTK